MAGWWSRKSEAKSRRRLCERDWCNQPHWLPWLLAAVLLAGWFAVLLWGDIRAAGAWRVACLAVGTMAVFWLLFVAAWWLRGQQWGLWINGVARVSLSRFQATLWFSFLVAAFITAAVIASVADDVEPTIADSLLGVGGAALAGVGGTGAIHAAAARRELTPEQRRVVDRSDATACAFEVVRDQAPATSRVAKGRKAAALVQAAQWRADGQPLRTLAAAPPAGDLAPDVVATLERFAKHPEPEGKLDVGDYCRANPCQMLRGDFAGNAHVLDPTKAQYLLVSVGALIATGIGVAQGLLDGAGEVLAAPELAVGALGISTAGYLGLKLPGRS